MVAEFLGLLGDVQWIHALTSVKIFTSQFAGRPWWISRWWPLTASSRCISRALNIDWYTLLWILPARGAGNPNCHGQCFPFLLDPLRITFQMIITFTLQGPKHHVSRRTYDTRVDGRLLSEGRWEKLSMVIAFTLQGNRARCISTYICTRFDSH